MRHARHMFRMLGIIACAAALPPVHLVARSGVRPPARPVARWSTPRADTLVAVRVVRCADTSYTYALYTPDARAALPALLLLHGAQGRPADLLDRWRPLAARERVALIAPQLPSTVAFEAVAPAVFRCVLSDARRAIAVDTARVYLFGYSMGGYLAFDGALLAGDLFAGAAVYGAAIADGYAGLVDRATRTMPIALYIGDRDAFYPVAQVRRTRDLLAAHGFPVRYVEFPNQDHGYAAVAAQVNADAWTFLTAHRPTPGTPPAP